MTREARRPILYLFVALAAVTVAVVYARGRPPSARERLETLRIELATLRSSVDSCQAALPDREARFDEYRTRVDSLRARVDALESLDPDGVPADSYATYLETFNRYNASLPGWSERADSLRLDWEACRALTEAHNSLADSVKGILVELGF